MKYFCLLGVLMGLTLPAHAQEPARRSYEVGLDVLSHAPSTSLGRPRWQGPSGGFVRYAPQRVGLRAGAAYFQRRTQEGTNCNDCVAGETTARTLTLRAGGQYAPLPQLPWLYAFTDAAHRQTVASGRYRGGFCGCLDFTETRTARGWGALAGVGATLRLPWRLALVPELSYEWFRTRHTTAYVDHRSPQRETRRFRSQEHTPALRLLATVSF